MDAFIEKTLTNHSGKIHLLWNNDYSWVVSQKMRHARKNIFMSTYKMEPKKKPKARNNNKLISQLVSANHRGLDVKVLMNYQQNKKATSSINTYAANVLAARGLTSRRLISGRILHAKIVIIDSSLLIIGSHNWSVLSHDRNIEFSLLIESEQAASEVQERFLVLWKLSEEFPGKEY